MLNRKNSLVKAALLISLASSSAYGQFEPNSESREDRNSRATDHYLQQLESDVSTQAITDVSIAALEYAYLRMGFMGNIAHKIDKLGQSSIDTEPRVVRERNRVVRERLDEKGRLHRTIRTVDADGKWKTTRKVLPRRIGRAARGISLAAQKSLRTLLILPRLALLTAEFGIFSDFAMRTVRVVGLGSIAGLAQMSEEASGQDYQEYVEWFYEDDYILIPAVHFASLGVDALNDLVSESTGLSVEEISKLTQEEFNARITEIKSQMSEGEFKIELRRRVNDKIEDGAREAESQDYQTDLDSDSVNTSIRQPSGPVVEPVEPPNSSTRID